LAFALGKAAALNSALREVQVTQERAEAATTLSDEQGFSFFSALGTILRGWALAEQGQSEEGIAQIRQGLAAWQAMRTELTRPTFLAFLAEAYGKVGQVEEGLTALAEALALVNKTGERNNKAELYRLKGMLTLQSKTSLRQVSGKSKTSQGRSEIEKGAEECFLKAIEIAQWQQAKSLELRVTMSLARLWQKQGKQHAARNMLSEIYNWFTEGFDTVDLQEAKALLEELA
jgi:predicted ATPase